MNPTEALQQQREQLKRDIIDYLVAGGISDREKIIKALQVIKESAWGCAPIDKELLKSADDRDYIKAAGLGLGQEFYFRISWHFTPARYKAIVEFVQRFERIEDQMSELEAAVDRAIDDEVYEVAHDPLSDFYYDELGGPDFAVCVYPDRIEVRAFEKGVGAKLPSQDRLYIGDQQDIRWQYPLNARARLERLGRPVVVAEEVWSKVKK